MRQKDSIGSRLAGADTRFAGKKSAAGVNSALPRVRPMPAPAPAAPPAKASVFGRLAAEARGKAALLCLTGAEREDPDPGVAPGCHGGASLSACPP